LNEGSAGELMLAAVDYTGSRCTAAQAPTRQDSSSIGLVEVPSRSREARCLSWPSSAWATQPLDGFSATDQPFVKRSLPFVTLLSGVAKSVGDEELW
jgi:hypothetical protein